MSAYAPIQSPTPTRPRASQDRPIRLDDSPLYPGPRRSIDADSDNRSDSDESDIVYRDALDDEPFDEKRSGGIRTHGVGNGPRGEEGDERWEEEGEMEDGLEGYAEPRRLRPRKRSRRVLAALVGVILLAAVVGAIAGSAYSVPIYGVSKGTKHVTMDHIFNGTFAPRTKTLAWLEESPDGTFSRLDDDHNIILSTVSNMSSSELLVDSSRVLDHHGERLSWQAWHLSPDGKYVLFRADSTQQWRHSTRGNYYIHRLSDSSTFPLITPSHPPRTALAMWAPVGHALAFVVDGDVYVVPSDALREVEGGNAAVRVTTDGSATVFNGVPDWVYEEEVFEGDSAMWWSPDGNTLAYLRSDETDVRDFKIPIYNPTDDAFAVNAYTTELDMKYPKPGTPNPLVTAHTFHLPTYRTTHSVALAKRDLDWPDALPLDERILVEVGWVGDGALLIKEIDRAARQGNNVVVFGHEGAEGKVVRRLGKDDEEGDDGWIEHGQNVVPVKSPIEGYLDIVPKDGFSHLALFSPVDASEPIWLTKGDWGEVTRIAGVDEEAGLVYFVAAAPSIDRHLFTIPLPSSVEEEYTSSRTALTDTSSPGYYDVSVSPRGGYYVLQYRGPEVPWQRVVMVRPDAQAEIEFAARQEWAQRARLTLGERSESEDVDAAGEEEARDEIWGKRGWEQLLEGNEALNRTLSEFARPIISRTVLKTDGLELNMLEMLPSNIDTSGRKKYPVLIKVYGGPNSQMVSNQFQRDWLSYLVEEKKYIVFIVDGRGTGYKGRALRNAVVNDLGHWEMVDQLEAGREAARRVYVDKKRIGIWGWSYGGYMTCKTIEADSGIFTLGMAVAPVTNWLYYDSIYTERYMSTPAANPEGYVSSAVNNVTAFGKVDFLLAHGSGDDNVHFANSASLVDKLTQKGVRGWRFRMFTDSNHSMNRRQGFREVYEWMTAFLEEKWGRGGSIRHG